MIKWGVWGVLTLIFVQAKAQSPDKPASIFDVQAVSEISWTADGKTVNVKKTDPASEQWRLTSGPKDFKPDPWNIHRRLVILSQVKDLAAVNLGDHGAGHPAGKIQIKTGKKSLEGEFNEQGFEWLNGDVKGQGYLFSGHPEVKELFDEGLKSLALHESNLCAPDKVTALDFTSLHFSVVKDKNKWVLTEGPKQNPARAPVILNFLKHLCHVEVDHFYSADSKSAAAEIIKIHEGKKEILLNKGAGEIFIFGSEPAFTSKTLAEELKVSADDFKDPSSEMGRVALDPSKPQNERIKAIRDIKDNKSVEGIPALKALVDEKTEIDLYRYEAVDALAAIDTKESFKIIADRLAEVGRSGFELRLARALALGMGHNFVSDEKTPEPQRRAEVQDLLDFYRKHPPGH